MVLAAALMLIPAAMVSNLTYRLHGEPEAPDTSDESVSHHMGWQMFRSNPTLVCLLAIVLSTQVIAAVLDFKFNELLSVEFAGATDMETAFQLRFWGFLNLASIGLQFVIAPLLLSFIALRLVHLMLPLIHFTAIIFAIIEPSVFSVGLAFFLFKAFDYSIFRAAKEILYIPLEFDARYRAKEVIDVFGYRTGKGGSSVLITLAQRAGVIMGNYYLYIAFFMAAIWLTLIFPLTRQKSVIRGIHITPQRHYFQFANGDHRQSVPGKPKAVIPWNGWRKCR